MITATPLTLQLAQALGLYILLGGLAGLAAPQRLQRMMDEVAASPALQLLAGAIAFALGSAIAIAHSLLTDPLAVAVTLCGWLALLKGALLIAVPGPLLRLGRPAMRHIRLWAIVMIVLGLLLALAGLTGRADAVQIV